jgi:sulfite reductase alpha subunit-like flavoprotein
VEPPAVDLPCTLRELVTRHLDVNTYPRRYFFEVLSFFTDDALHQAKLRELSSAEGQVRVPSRFPRDRCLLGTKVRAPYTHHTPTAARTRRTS